MPQDKQCGGAPEENKSINQNNDRCWIFGNGMAETSIAALVISQELYQRQCEYPNAQRRCHVNEGEKPSIIALQIPTNHKIQSQSFGAVRLITSKSRLIRRPARQEANADIVEDKLTDS
jgi:hypothetical protein